MRNTDLPAKQSSVLKVVSVPTDVALAGSLGCWKPRESAGTRRVFRQENTPEHARAHTRRRYALFIPQTLLQCHVSLPSHLRREGLTLNENSDLHESTSAVVAFT